MSFLLLLDKKGAGVNDDAGGGAFYPGTSLPGMNMLLDVDKHLSGNDGDAIATATEQFGNIFSQATTTKKPTLKTGANGINSNKILRFDAGDLLVASNFLSDTSGSLFAVFRLSATPTGNQILLSSFDEATVAESGVAFYGYFSGAGPNVKLFQRNSADVADELRGSTEALVNTSYLVIFQSSGTAYTFRLNGAAQTLAIVTGANTGDWFGDSANRDNVVLGAGKWSAEAQFLKGDLAMIGHTGTPLSTANIAALESYCSSRFGLGF